MKAKLGKLSLASKVQYGGFKTLLKKSVLATLKDTANEHRSSYVLVKGEQMNWNCGDKDPDKPLFYLDQNYNALVKEIKASKEIDLKSYSYGQCKVTQVGTDITIYLCPEKGKLTQPAQFKPLQRIFKKFKPKLFFEIVADLATIEADESDINTKALEEEEGDDALFERAKAIVLRLLKYHQQFKIIDKQVKALDAADPKRQKLRIKRHTLLKHIKHLTTAWTEEISPQQEELPLEASWIELHNYWVNAFAKQQAAKEGAATTVDARKAEEEHLYIKTLEDLQRFFDDLEKGKTVDPDIIENDIQTLEDHLAEWQKFAKGKSAFPAELKEMEKHIANLQAEWKTEKGRIEAYHKSVQELDKALENRASEEEIMKLYKMAESLANA